MGDTAIFNCTIMGNVLFWRYSNIPVGPGLLSTDSTPVTRTHTVDGIMFTLNHISTDNGILISRLSFTAVMATNGEIILCFNGGGGDDTTIAVGSDKDRQPCTSTIKFTCLLPTDSPPVVSVVGVVSVANALVPQHSL